MGRNFLDNPVLLVVLLLIIVVVFGANKLPTAARSLGRSMRIFKSEVKALNDDEEDEPQTNNAKRSPEAVEGRVIDPPENTAR